MKWGHEPKRPEWQRDDAVAWRSSSWRYLYCASGIERIEFRSIPPAILTREWVDLHVFRRIYACLYGL
jgi:hypothetical protein